MPEAAEKSELYQEVTRAALLGLFVNLSLGAVKLTGGLIGDSFALLADSFNSLGDVFTSAIILFSLWISQRPADKEHPYGHTRAETIAASNVCLIIIIGALILGVESIRRLSLIHELPPTWTLWIAGGNFVIKEGLYHYKVAVGNRTQSTAILANAWDHRSDALCSLAVLVGLAVVLLAGEAYIWADEAAATFVVIAIIWSTAQLFRKSVNDLMDPQAGEDLVGEVREIASAVEGVSGVEKLRLRKSGLEYFADIHIEVDPEISVAEGHYIGHAVKDSILAEFSKIRDVLIHLEPAPVASSDRVKDR